MDTGAAHSDRTTGSSSCTPIGDYAVIGDCHGAALVGRDGSVDWCCLERFDADPVFCRLLGGERAGFFEIRPVGDYRVRRGYLPGTNILQTTFLSAEGAATLTDFMPLGRSSAADAYVSINAPHWLVRRLECSEGHVEFSLRYRPCGSGFGAQSLALRKHGRDIGPAEGPQLYSDVDFDIVGDIAAATVDVHAGQTVACVVTPGHAAHDHPCERADALLAVTRAFWEEWLSGCNYDGPYRDAVHRSALVLKLLTYAPTGAIVAAPTTSLPECLGGERNWDYRYCWLRDATFILYSLAALGFESEAGRFNGFLLRCLQESAPDVRIMYGIEYETELAERTLDHLPGYCDSRPVRTGNGAYTQRQFDVYGEVLDWALLHRTLGGRISEAEKRLLKGMADHVAASWGQPGQGIWEMRGAPRHHVYSKIMCWVALDRAVRLFGANTPWLHAKEAIREAILERGIDASQGYLRQSFDNDGIDAAVLTAPLTGFPLEQRTLAHTVDAVQRLLCRDGLVRRYLGTGAVDGVAGEEGTFLACSFWLVDALLFLDRHDEAIVLFETLLSKMNDVGLLSEEIDSETGRLLGNFPQGLSHLALIRSAFVIDLYRQGGSALLHGAHADRAQQHASLSKESAALWTAFKSSPRRMPQPSSTASVLHPFWRSADVAAVHRL
jgi:GH15 family glucan-1,4-alpha-glucosidase